MLHQPCQSVLFSVCCWHGCRFLLPGGCPSLRNRSPRQVFVVVENTHHAFQPAFHGQGVSPVLQLIVAALHCASQVLLPIVIQCVTGDVRLPVEDVEFVFVGLFFFSCSQDKNVVNVYSGRHYQVDEDLFRAFTERTGIRVNLVKADTDQLLNRLEMEGSNSPTDLLITADAGRLVTAAASGLLQPIASDYMQQVIPGSMRDPDNRWVAMTKRARVIVYHKDRVNPEDLSTYEALSYPEWSGRVLVRSSQNHYNQTLMASVIAALGHDEAADWAGRLVQNMARRPRGNDRDQVKAIVAGEGDVAIVNTYYMGLLKHSINPEERLVAQQTRIFFPNQEDRGTHVNYSGMGLIRASSNPGNAHAVIKKMLLVMASIFLFWPVDKRLWGI